MSDNLTLFGDVADDFDQNVTQTQKILDRYVEKSGYSFGSMALASTTMAFVLIGQSFVDTLRLGNGIARGGWRGYGSDALRFLNVAGVSGAAWTRISKILVVKQVQGTVTCVWITAANALRRTGQRFFVTIEDLARSANVDLSAVARAGGTTTAQIQALLAALQRMSLAVKAVSPNGTSLQALADLAKANSGGALAFGIQYQSAGKTFGHMMYATYSAVEGVTVIDTTGKIYRGVQAVAAAYPNATLVQGASFSIKNAAIVSAAKAADAAAGLANLVIQLMPVEMKTQAEPMTRFGMRYRR